MQAQLIKALLINAAYTGANAVCADAVPPGAGAIPVDPLIADTGLRDKGTMVYEEAKIQYAALLRGFEDKTGIWPDPKVPEDPAAAGGIGAVAGKLFTGDVLAKLVAAVPPDVLAGLIPVLTGLVGKIPAAVPAIAAGAAVAAAS